MKIRIDINFQISRVIKYFIISDLFFIAGYGLISPIFAIFVVEKIAGATIATVGVAAAVYWILKAILQLPIGVYLDKTEGEKDDFYILIGGLVLASVTAFLFVFVTKVWQLYLVQAVHALAFALYTPSWTAIFSRHLDKNRYAFDWALNSTTVAFASGVSGALGGWLAQEFGFPVIFIGAAVLSFVAAVVIFLLPDVVLPKTTTNQPLLPPRDHRPPTIGH